MSFEILNNDDFRNQKIANNVSNNRISVSNKHSDKIDRSLFTFQPKLNRKSASLVSQNILSFKERQDLHTKRQLEMLKEAYRMCTNDYGKLLHTNNYGPNIEFFFSQDTSKYNKVVTDNPDISST